MPALSDTLALEKKLTAARERERAARAHAARLRRSLARAGRRVEAQRLCILGAALTAWAEADPEVRERALAWLRGYVVRETDRAALAGSWADVR